MLVSRLGHWPHRYPCQFWQNREIYHGYSGLPQITVDAIKPRKFLRQLQEKHLCSKFIYIWFIAVCISYEGSAGRETQQCFSVEALYDGDPPERIYDSKSVNPHSRGNEWTQTSDDLGICYCSY